MPSSGPSRSFKVGESVHLRATASIPGTRSPKPATVTLVSLTRDGVAQPVDTTLFTESATGDYRLSIATEGRTPGVYDVLVRMVGEPDEVMLLTDRFVLDAA